MMKISVLLSSRGSNFQSIYRAIESGTIQNAEIACIISNKETAKGLLWAEEKGLKTYYVNPKEYLSRSEYDQKILEILQSENTDLVLLAGYMRIVSDVLVNEYYGRMMNIHPALLPSFPGLNAQKQALDYGVKISGCTVHFVDCGMDSGPIIMQKSVEVLAGDDEETLSARILSEEHKLYPKAVGLFTSGRIKLNGNKVEITDLK